VVPPGVTVSEESEAGGGVGWSGQAVAAAALAGVEPLVIAAVADGDATRARLTNTHSVSARAAVGLTLVRRTLAG
jgi:hypothetical protein